MGVALSRAFLGEPGWVVAIMWAETAGRLPAVLRLVAAGWVDCMEMNPMGNCSAALYHWEDAGSSQDP